MRALLHLLFCNGAEHFASFFTCICREFAVKKNLQVVVSIGKPVHKLPVDLLFYSVFGYVDAFYFSERTIAFLICGEPQTPPIGKAHALIDCKQTTVPTTIPFLYFPFYVLSFVERFHHTYLDLTQSKVWPSKTKFCAFLYSHDIEHRNRFFDRLCKYKKVDALGKCRNATNTTQVKFDRGVFEEGKTSYNDLAVQKYKPYKFVICIENSCLKGYITEKIISAMLAGCIPIYLGAPDISNHFNSKSFINVTNFKSVDECIQFIARLDQNDTEYNKMAKEPWFENNKLNSYFDKTPIRDLIVQLMKLKKNSVYHNQNVDKLG